MIRQFTLSILFTFLLAISVNAHQILLIGSDSRENNKRGNADVIMIITVKDNEVKLTSIMRDTYVYIKGYGNQKLNAAYKLGGRDLLVRTINANFKTDLSSTIVTDFKKTAEVIDKFGGVKLNVDKDIYPYVNGYILEQASVKGMAVLPLTKTGEVTLTGDQAVAYARVRVAGTKYDDHARVERQKEVTKAMLNFAINHKAVAFKNFYELWSLIDTDISMTAFWKICKILIKKPKVPKSQVFPGVNSFTNQRIKNVGLVLKVNDFRKASKTLNSLIK
ncbi:MAG: hypothetical protein EOO86_00375 [Pedobacter sp.]|nr:MAG: hypothetical protein EOO86_00375 [Pedobacter sp.]